MNYKMTLAFYLGSLLLLSGCKLGTTNKGQFDLQGHRGARGEAPENTLPAITQGLRSGVHTLELDLALSSDTAPLLSHDPWIHPRLCLDSSGADLADTTRIPFSQLTLREIQRYDCGSLTHPDFPGQKSEPAAKPALLEAILHAEENALLLNRDPPRYNLEIKSKEAWDGKYYPSIEIFVDQVLKEVRKAKTFERTTLQSFDLRVLRYAHREYPDLKLSLLAGPQSPPVEKLLEKLEFLPDVYSPHQDRPLTKQKIKALQTQGLKVIPWTVNEITRAQELSRRGVDGLITDFPGRLVSALGV